LIDGQYLGYLDEAQGSEKDPAASRHAQAGVRQNGYVISREMLCLHPREKQGSSDLSMV